LFFKANETGVLLRDVLAISLQSLSSEGLLRTADARIFPDMVIGLILSKQLERRIPWASAALDDWDYASDRNASAPQRGSHGKASRLPVSPKTFHEAVSATFESYLSTFGKVTMDEGLSTELGSLFQKLREISTSAPRLEGLLFTKASSQNDAIGNFMTENELLEGLPRIGDYPHIDLSLTAEPMSALSFPDDKRVGEVAIRGSLALPLHLPSLAVFQQFSGIACRSVSITDVSVSPGALAGHLDSPIRSEILTFARSAPITLDHVSAISGWLDLRTIKKVILVETAFGSFGMHRLLELVPNLSHLFLENTHISKGQLDGLFEQKPDGFVFLEMKNCTSDIELSRWFDYQSLARDSQFVIRYNV
jgi:hypothetical protein